jgi:hypothetical protein
MAFKEPKNGLTGCQRLSFGTTVRITQPSKCPRLKHCVNMLLHTFKLCPFPAMCNKKSKSQLLKRITCSKPSSTT